MLAQLRAGIMNSIPETLVTLRIDEKDPDPRKTIQIANVMALQSRSNSGLIIGASNVQTIEDRVKSILISVWLSNLIILRFLKLVTISLVQLLIFLLLIMMLQKALNEILSWVLV